MTFFWTEETEAKAKVLYIDRGLSAEQTARALGGCCTRNSVIGKAHRLGWMKAHRQKPATPKAERPAPKPKAAPKPPKPGPQNKPAVVFGKVGVLNAEETAKRQAEQRKHGAKIIADFKAPANDTAIPLMERRRYQCAWPMGIPDRPAQQMCCGMPVPQDAHASIESYCPTHAAAAMARKPGMPKPSLKKFERSLRRYAA